MRIKSVAAWAATSVVEIVLAFATQARDVKKASLNIVLLDVGELLCKLVKDLKSELKFLLHCSIKNQLIFGLSQNGIASL